MKKIVIPGLLMLITLRGKAQDMTFSQFNSVPMYFNPAFAGSVEKSRLALSYRNQWGSAYQNYLLTYDQAIKKLHGGVGIVIYDDNSGQGTLNTFYSGLVYAPKFNLFSKLSISPAVKIGYMRRSLDAGNLTFGDQIDPTRGFVYTTPSESIISKRNMLDISSGILVNTEKFYAGFATDHITQPNVSFIEGGESALPIKYIGQIGYTFLKSDSADFTITPSAMYQKQWQFELLQLNVSIRYKKLIAGAGYANAKNFIAMAGYYGKKVIVGYSYDYNSNFNTSEVFYGTHEISFRYIFDLRKQKEEIKKEG